MVSYFTSPRLRGEVDARAARRVRGDSPRAESVESPPHPKPSASTSPRKRSEVKWHAHRSWNLQLDYDFKQLRSTDTASRSRARICASLAGNVRPSKDQGRRECRMPDASVGSCAM